MDENHAHLVTLGVSHPVLEQIKSITAKPGYGLHTKLTGAGGGGCAVTLIPDEFSESNMSALLSELSAAGFVPYNTAVGGSELDVFHPHSNEGRSTPVEQTSEAGEAFGKVSVGDLAAWADGVGRWLYV